VNHYKVVETGRTCQGLHYRFETLIDAETSAEAAMRSTSYALGGQTTSVRVIDGEQISLENIERNTKKGNKRG
jgi:hypothetical protein